MKLSAPIFQLKRRAKLLARDQKIALNDALDRVAKAEGFARWSLLSARFTLDSPAKAILPRLTNGDLFLLGARPGQGKTLLGFQLLIDAIGEGRAGVFFTLDYARSEIEQHLLSLGTDPRDLVDRLDIVTSDDIDADHIVRHLTGAAPGTIVIVDYLQILDQQRSKPPLADQMPTLRDFARRSGVVIGFVSQIDRSFDARKKGTPDLSDVRLPNPLDLGLFSKACFVHDGDVRLQQLA